MTKQFGNEVFAETSNGSSFWRIMRGKVDGYSVPVSNKIHFLKEDAEREALLYAHKWGDNYKGVYLYDEKENCRKDISK